MADDFEGLPVYQAAAKLRQRVFTLVGKLPKDEKFVLNPTMRKAALGVTNQIAQSTAGDNWKQSIGLLHRAAGNVNQIIDCLNAIAEQKHFKPEHLSDLRADADRVKQLIDEHIAGLQQQIQQYMQQKRSKAASNRGGGRGGGRGNGGGSYRKR